MYNFNNLNYLKIYRINYFNLDLYNEIFKTYRIYIFRI